MPPDNAPAQITELLSNTMLHRLERLRLNASGRFTQRMQGEHLSAKGGSSMEFADYRDYVEGDDTRFVDWNIFSRLGRPYIKLFHHEEQMQIVLLIDASASMLHENKLFRAKQLAAALCVCSLFSGEPVSLWSFGQAQTGLTHLGPTRGRAARGKCLRFIQNIQGGGDVPLDHAIEELLKQHRSRGVVVLLSDFLTWGNLKHTFNRLHSAGLEIFACQILSPKELNPELTADLRLVDCENQDVLDVSAGQDLLGIYQEYRLAFENTLATLARQRGGRFVSLSSQDDLNSILMDTFRREGWLR